MRFLPFLAVVLLVGCGAGGPAEVEGQPVAYHASGSSAYVESVERENDRLFVTLRFVNGSDRRQQLGSRNDPPTLTDAGGATLTAAEEALAVPAFSSDRLRLAFAGTPGEGPLTLRLNGEYGNTEEWATDPAFAVPDLPREARFALGALPTGGAVQGVQANHANGTSVVVEEVRFDTLTTAVVVRAVNGRDGPITLSPRNDAAFLLDDRGTRYPLVPPASDPTLRVASGQALTGTLRFAGRPTPEAQTLTLHLNEEYGNTEDWATSPRITLPAFPITR